MDFDKTLQKYQETVERAIRDLTPPSETRPERLHSAMRYSLEAGGKRLRPILLISAHKLFESEECPLAAAVAIEMLHTYTLIHDDLPCMDDSDLRRGTPTCHKAFDEETALLAGDGLLTGCFNLIAKAYRHTPEIAVALIADLSQAAGSEELIGGQMEDLLGEKESPNKERLEFIHRNKTAALIAASLTMGARIANLNADILAKVKQMGVALGLAFQVVDDILDETADETTLGKPVGADQRNDKMTYPSLYGLDASRIQAKAYTDDALSLCHEIGGKNAFLLELIKKMEKRIH